MRIDNNLDGMLYAQMQVNQSAQNIASIPTTTQENTSSSVSQDLIDSIVQQIPNVASYQANAKGIETQNEVSDMLLNIKA